MTRKIWFRLWAGFFFMVGLVLVVGAVGLVNVSQLNEASQMLSRQAGQVSRLRVIQAGLDNVQLAVTDAISTRSEGVLLRASILARSLNEQIAAYEHSSAAAEGYDVPTGTVVVAADTSCASHCHGAPDVMDLENKRVAFDQAVNQYLGMAEVQEVYMPEATAKLGRANMDMQASLDTLAKTEQDTMVRVQADAAAAQSRALYLTIGLGLVALILASIFAFTITRSITRPLAHLVSVADKISMGEMDTPIQVKPGDEIGDVAESFERMRTSLKAMLERMKARPSA